MLNSIPAVAPYAPRRYQGLDQKTNTVSNQLTVREVQWNMTDLPSASSSESVPTTSWKPIIIVLTVLVVVVCAAAVGIPFLVTYLNSASEFSIILPSYYEITTIIQFLILIL
ncbi:unnamed protein product [Rotaria magnacalcarata]|uniref:Uncharacterized protein n=1 Tax=Rotaria magnacalcarata TaxID=392030 RepID=A0A816RHG8_9BILA|nr:unnamed protein product [Rotaria magnacalcarata]CAF5174358.1 unnamed protein product [Rotaria magnacalcarata]